MIHYISSNTIKLLLLFSGYFLGIQYLAIAVGVFVLIDLLSGIMASFKINGVKSFKSSKLKRTVYKITCYALAMISTFVLEREIFGLDGILISNLVAGYIALTEFASIMENLAKITGNNVFLKIYETVSTYFNKNKNIIDNIDGNKPIVDKKENLDIDGNPVN